MVVAGQVTIAQVCETLKRRLVQHSADRTFVTETLTKVTL